MKLYFAKGSCSLAVRILMNELNIDCQYESVNLGTKTLENGENFLTINAKGSVPVLEVDGKILTENAVIHQYLADTYKATQLLPSLGDFKRYQVLEWLNYVATEIHKGIGILFTQSIPDEIKNSVFIPTIEKKLAYLDKHFQTHSYLMGENFTLPDGYLFTVLNWLKIFKIDLHQWPTLFEYFKTVKARPSVAKSLAQEGLG